eukprot:RCo002597
MYGQPGFPPGLQAGGYQPDDPNLAAAYGYHNPYQPPPPYYAYPPPQPQPQHMGPHGGAVMNPGYPPVPAYTNPPVAQQPQRTGPAPGSPPQPTKGGKATDSSASRGMPHHVQQAAHMHAPTLPPGYHPHLTPHPATQLFVSPHTQPQLAMAQQLQALPQMPPPPPSAHYAQHPAMHGHAMQGHPQAAQQQPPPFRPHHGGGHGHMPQAEQGGKPLRSPKGQPRTSWDVSADLGPAMQQVAPSTASAPSVQGSEATSPRSPMGGSGGSFGDLGDERNDPRAQVDGASLSADDDEGREGMAQMAAGHHMYHPNSGMGAESSWHDPKTSSPYAQKKTYSVDFLLKFQHDSTEPPEKIKNFAAYMPTSQHPTVDPMAMAQYEAQARQHMSRAGVPRRTSPMMAPDRDFPPRVAPYAQRPLMAGIPGQDILDHRVERPFRRLGTAEDDSVSRRVNGILNKITPEKYEALLKNLLEDNFDVTNQEVLNEIITCIFECAVRQTKFCNLYADLCRDLTQKFSATTAAAAAAASAKSKEAGMPDTPKTTAYASFRRALLNKCQTEFERPQVANDPSLTPEERAELEGRMKKRQLGNIKFIGELFKRKMLTEKIMHDVIKRLLLGGGGRPVPGAEHQPPEHAPTDEEIEVLCTLLATVGQQLDRAPAAAYMNLYFEKLQSLLDGNTRSARIRFILQSVIELRQNQWVPRRQEEKVQTLAELENTRLRREAARNESVQQTIEQQRRNPPGFPGVVPGVP